jgi:hypothetical protein
MMCNKLLNDFLGMGGRGRESHILNPHDLKDIGPITPEVLFLCLSTQIKKNKP